MAATKRPGTVASHEPQGNCASTPPARLANSAETRFDQLPILIGEFEANTRETARVILEHYRGHDLVYICKWYRDRDGKLLPGSKGFAVNVADAVARAGGYLDYAAGMLHRVTSGLAIGQAEVDAAAIARHLLAMRPARLNEREIYQTAGFAWAREDDRRAAALGVLDQAGWIRQSQRAGRGHPRRDWEVSPRVAEVHS